MTFLSILRLTMMLLASEPFWLFTRTMTGWIKYCHLGILCSEPLQVVEMQGRAYLCFLFDVWRLPWVPPYICFLISLLGLSSRVVWLQIQQMQLQLALKSSAGRKINWSYFIMQRWGPWQLEQAKWMIVVLYPIYGFATMQVVRRSTVLPASTEDYTHSKLEKAKSIY